jgi:hypothetical protein
MNNKVVVTLIWWITELTTNLEFHMIECLAVSRHVAIQNFLIHDRSTTLGIHAAIDATEENFNEHLSIQLADIGCRVDDILTGF